MNVNSLAKENPTPCWGEQVCRNRGWTFGEVFRHQFRIGRSPIIGAWPNCELGRFSIEHCPDLPVTRVLSRRGELIGWCLGVAVDAAGTAIGCGDGSPVTITASFEAVERLQSRLAGRFALLISIGGDTRYYPDAASSLTAVLHPEAQVIASTVPLAIRGAVQPSGGRSLQEIRRKHRLYLMGETIDARVSQAFGNHYVDLQDFSSHRFWPKDDTSFQPHDDAESCVDQIATRLQTIMTALVSRFDCTLPLTGGQDSRVLAAALRPESVTRLSHAHVHEINWATGFDVAAAVKVAEHLNLPLEVKRVTAGECDEELADMDVSKLRGQMALATGYAYPQLRKNVIQAMQVAPPAFLLLRGGAAELAHANKWPHPPRIPDEVTPDFAFERLAGHSFEDLRASLGDSTVERYWDAYQAWFRGLPEGARARAPDVGHAELWLSGPFGTVFNAPRQHFYLNPFNDHGLIHRTMRFDPKMRRRGLLVKALLDRLSPGLADIPYARQLLAANRAA